MMKFLYMIIIFFIIIGLKIPKKKKTENIEYIFPLENLETIATIKKIKKI